MSPVLSALTNTDTDSDVVLSWSRSTSTTVILKMSPGAGIFELVCIEIVPLVATRAYPCSKISLPFAPRSKYCTMTLAPSLATSDDDLHVTDKQDAFVLTGCAAVKIPVLNPVSTSVTNEREELSATATETLMESTK